MNVRDTLLDVVVQTQAMRGATRACVRRITRPRDWSLPTEGASGKAGDESLNNASKLAVAACRRRLCFHCGPRLLECTHPSEGHGLEVRRDSRIRWNQDRRRCRC